MADGQATQGSQIAKPNVLKVRRIGKNVITGFAGSTGDAFTLFEELEKKLTLYPDQLTRAAVAMAKDWRTDKYLRKLEASMIVADATESLNITGNGDVLSPHDGILSIGSGGAFAGAAARALMDIDGLDAMTIAKKAMNIAADADIYTNHNFRHEVIGGQVDPSAESAAAESIPK
eukprot:CAMPEP_0206140958 /NCGR_PEP_ID=MMETSP1473-20131121/11322_1 /ASSEMBLY_ACC=CAM_ASM_001109 /TAXON_ID=1461547 /ORGANISM="Stichococcus sp, Strain RCC1054" /LENGTH=174 /DNA_ID=CAMNT_0053535323 /DNA_START=337 /DNA_END=861 /DNA_ORIENTATION=-